MFHRVKSEVQDEQKESVAVEEKPEATEEVTQMETPQSTFELDPEDEPELSIESEETAETPEPETTPEEEDTSTMTDNETQTEETAAESFSPYQRTGSAPAASGYPGSSYPGSQAGYGATSPSMDADASDRRLTIGRGITMSGEIESCDYLLVEGTVEAALKGANMLEIAESGTFYGTVEIEEANISGRFEGDITVNGRLTISSTGTVTGSISYKELEIEAGAVVDGKLTPMSAVAAAPAKKPAAKKPASKAKKVEAQPEPANNDEGLFSKATAAAE